MLTFSFLALLQIQWILLAPPPFIRPFKGQSLLTSGLATGKGYGHFRQLHSVGRSRWVKLNLAVSPQPLPLQRLHTACTAVSSLVRRKWMNSCYKAFASISLENIKLHRSSWQWTEQHCGSGRSKGGELAAPKCPSGSFLLGSISLEAVEEPTPLGYPEKQSWSVSRLAVTML